MQKALDQYNEHIKKTLENQKEAKEKVDKEAEVQKKIEELKK